MLSDDVDTENIFEGEGEFVSTHAQSFSDDEYDEASGEGNVTSTVEADHFVVKALKKEKKKEKFKKMKSKKVDCSSEIATEISADSRENISAEKQYETFIASMPDDSSVRRSLSSSDFFNPYQRDANKKPCPFVRAIAAGLPSYKAVLEESSALDDNHGSPLVLVVSSGARRAADVINGMSKLLQCKIAKLFAKHFKIQEQIDVLSRQNYPVAVGTPNRLSKLCEFGALKLHCVKIVLIDLFHDKKNFTVLSMPDVKTDLHEFLESYILPECSHLQLALVVP